MNEEEGSIRHTSVFEENFATATITARGAGSVPKPRREGVARKSSDRQVNVFDKIREICELRVQPWSVLVRTGRLCCSMDTNTSEKSSDGVFGFR